MIQKKLASVKKVLDVFLSFILLLGLFLTTIASIHSFVTGTPNFFGYQLKAVQSGSMEPEFTTGSLIIIKPMTNKGKLVEGNIITYQIEGQQTVTHRIVEVLTHGDMTMYRTKGDRNATADLFLVPPEKVVGVYTGIHIPYVGFVSSSFPLQRGFSLILIISGLLLVACAVSAIVRKNTFKDAENRKEGVR